jgi:hypothetical protein
VRVELFQGAVDGEPAAEAAVQKFPTSVDRAARLAVEGVDVAALLRRFGIREGQRFVLGADGAYDVELNRFFRELDGWLEAAVKVVRIVP